MAVALIFEMDRVNGKKMRRPNVKAVVCDGYILYSEKEIDGQIQCDIRARDINSASPRGMARAIINMEQQIGEKAFSTPMMAEFRQAMRGMVRNAKNKVKTKSAAIHEEVACANQSIAQGDAGGSTLADDAAKNASHKHSRKEESK